jgi:DNA uptake protein ComE-like DNA-binding protein
LWGRKGPQGTDRRVPRISKFKEVSMMTRLRTVSGRGILWIVLALTVSSLVLAQSKKQLDINSASEEEMVSAGIEKAAAKKIVEARPYRNKAELVSRQLLTKAQYDKLKDLLVAKQAAEMKEAKTPIKPAGKPVGK